MCPLKQATQLQHNEVIWDRALIDAG